MDLYSELRRIPLSVVLQSLGFTDYKQKGENWTGVCPFHNGKTRTFSFTESKFHCFSCEKGGVGAIDLLKAFGKSFTEAVEYLKTIPVATENQPISFNYEKYYQPCDWLLEKFSQEVLDHFGVGLYDNPSRKSSYTGKVMFPIRRFSDGQKVAYAAMENWNSPVILPKNFASHLEVYGAYELKARGLTQGRGRIVLSPLEVLELPVQLSDTFPVYCFGQASPEQGEILASLFSSVYVPSAKAAEIFSAYLWVRQETT